MSGIRDSVADLVIDGCAHTLRKALIVERRRDAAHTDGGLIYNAVNILGGHARTDLFGHCIKAGHIDLRTLPDPVHLCRCLQNTVIRNDGTGELKLPEFFVKAHMAGFVFTSAPAPARVIALNFMLSEMNHSKNFLSAEVILSVYYNLFSTANL